MPVIEHINVNGVTYDIGGGTDNGNGKIFYGTCSGGSSNPIAVSCSAFTSSDLTAGTMVIVNFTADASVTNGITLSVNGTTAKNIVYNYDNGSASGTYIEYFEANSVHVFVYDGYVFVCIDRMATSIPYTEVTSW